MLALSSEGAVVSVYDVGQCSESRRGNIIISSVLCSALIGLCEGILYGCQYLHWTDRIIIKVSSQSSLSAACTPPFPLSSQHTHWHTLPCRFTVIFTLTFECVCVWGGANVSMHNHFHLLPCKHFRPTHTHLLLHTHLLPFPHIHLTNITRTKYHALVVLNCSMQSSCDRDKLRLCTCP